MSDAQEKVAEAAETVAESEEIKAEAAAQTAEAVEKEALANATAATVAAAQGAVAVAQTEAAKAVQDNNVKVNQLEEDVKWLRNHAEQTANLLNQNQVTISEVAANQSNTKTALEAIQAALQSSTLQTSEETKAANPAAMESEKSAEGRQETKDNKPPAKKAKRWL